MNRNISDTFIFSFNFFGCISEVDGNGEEKFRCSGSIDNEWK